MSDRFAPFTPLPTSFSRQRKPTGNRRRAESIARRGGWLRALLPAAIISFCVVSASLAQSPGLSIPIKVNSASLPVTIGVPLGEAADVRDAAQLGVTDPNGAPVPAQMRVLARWRGAATDTSKPIKWVLVDFKPSVTGSYRLTRVSAQATPPVLSVSSSADKILVTTSRLGLEVSGQGNSLITGFRLDGTSQLRAPVTVSATVPRGGVVVRMGSSSEALYLNDASLLNPGEMVRFEHRANLTWETAGFTRLYVNDATLLPGHRYLLDEGTPRQEEVMVSASADGQLTYDAPLKFNHPAGSTIRDLTVEQDTATIKSISGQLVQFAAPLKQTHSTKERLNVISQGGNSPVTASAVIDHASVEEAGSLRTVIRQDGHFVSATPGIVGRVLPDVSFTARYYIYADQPFIRVRLRLVNHGTYGYGADRAQQPPFAQHALVRSLSAFFPTVSAGSGSLSVLTAADAHARVAARQSGATLAAGAFEISAPEFAENFPKAMSANSGGLRFDLLPDVGSDHNFEGGRAKTTDFYLGRQTGAAMALTSSSAATLDPAYMAKTGAVRPAMIERRAWSQVYQQDAELGEAAASAERLFASAYAVEACEGDSHQPPQSIFEYRLRGEYGEHFGWQNFGDLAWGDGYDNLHYDLPYQLLREHLRTGDARAWQIGSEMARYRADWGHYHADDYWDSWHALNLRGLSFYEKGAHGSYREPVFSHHWIEGLWLYWALTGDEAVHESAVEAGDAVERFNFTYDNVLSWNEPRMAGWPALAMVVAWRYSGDLRYLVKARDLVYLLMQTEEDFGRKGYYSAGNDAIQPLMWSGYSQLGVIEFWRETGDQRVAAFIVRVADWVLGKGGLSPVLLGGERLVDGSYRPLGTSIYWTPDKPGENVITGLGMMHLPVLTTAARITNRDDLRRRARQLFRDVTFYRDFAEGPLPPASRSTINFRSSYFAASSPKIYGQTGLAIADYLAELNGSITLAQAVPALPAPKPVSTPITPNPTTPVSCLGTMAFSGLTNVALHRPASASSVHLWGDATDVPGAANDGLMEVPDGRHSLWHSESNTRRLEWWQVDLEQPTRISGLEILFRTDMSQANTRRNFEVRASNDPTFATSTLLAAQGPEPHPFRQAWQARVSDANTYRYVRVRKTGIDADEYGEEYFNLSEVRVYAAESNASYTGSSTDPISVAELRSKTVMVGQTLSFTLMKNSPCGQPVRHTVYGLPKNAAFDGDTGAFTFTPSDEQADQMYQVSFRSGDASSEITTRLDIAVIRPGAPRVTMLAPAGAARLVMNETALVSWATEATSPVTKYQVRLSTDGGATWPRLIAELPGTAQQFAWKIPDSSPELRRSLVRLMVTAIDSNNRIGIDCTHEDLQVAASMTVTSSASYRRETLAAGAICTAFGGELTGDGTAVADRLPLPYEIRGTRVLITDSQGRQFQAPLFYTSQYQINFLLPEEAAPGEAVATVISSTGEVSETRINVVAVAPALFTADASGGGEAVMISTTDGARYEAGAVKQVPGRDVYVVLFGTGWRGANAGVKTPVTVEINNVTVPVLYADRQPGYAGLDQINFLLPRNLPAGAHSLAVRVGGLVSNTTVIRVY